MIAEARDSNRGINQNLFPHIVRSKVIMLSNYCSYFQALVVREKCWFFTATLRSYEHLVFDRTLNKSESKFEFFVPAGNESCFLQVMALLEEEGVVHSLKKLPNRLAEPNARL